MNGYSGGAPESVEAMCISLPIDESLPDKLGTKVGCLAFGIINQCLDNKLSLFLSQECRGFGVLTKYQQKILRKTDIPTS